MATYTSNYAWTKPEGSDPVDITVLNNNLDSQDNIVHNAYMQFAPVFSTASTYAVDDVVLYANNLYKCITAVTVAGAWDAAKWTQVKVSDICGGGGGTSDYSQLTNKPSINSVTLSGNKTSADLGLQDAIQIDTMPTASATYVGKIVQFIGTTTASYTHGYYYECINNGGTYSWTQLNVQPSSGGGTSDYTDLTNKPQINGVTLTGNKSTSDLGITASEVGAIPSTDKGANGGVAELDSNGKVPSSQLPSYVDDVLSYSSQSAFPVTGETGKIYIAEDTNKTYRWSGSAYAEISASLALGETSSTAYRGDRGKVAYDHSQTTGNPHGTTASDVGLGNVPNVSTNDQEPTFTEATTRNNITSGEKLSVILGKIQKFFNDLKTVAFTGSFSDLTNKPSINSVTLSGNKTASDLGLQDELTFDNVPTNGSNNPVKSDGVYDSEKDIYAVMGEMGAKNLIPYPYLQITSSQGITWTDNGDGTITADGTATGNSWVYLTGSSSNPTEIPITIKKLVGKEVILTSGEDATNVGLRIAFYDESKTELYYTETSSVAKRKFTIPLSSVYMSLQAFVYMDNTVSNLKFYPMLRLASDTDDTYQPYAKTNKELTKSYPASHVMLSDGVTSVEDALDGLTANTLGTAVDLTSYSSANPYVTPSDGYIQCETASSGAYVLVAIRDANNVIIYMGANQTGTHYQACYVKKGLKIYHHTSSGTINAKFYPLQ